MLSVGGPRIFPVEPVHLALYLQHLGNITQSKSAVEEAVSWTHKVAGLSGLENAPDGSEQSTEGSCKA